MEIELTIFEDCLSLINKFEECSDPCFKTFCQQWHDLQFQYIYGAQTTAIEVIQTTKTILHLAKRVVCPINAFENLVVDKNDLRQTTRRIGGIYLMYTIYFKQPTNKYAKILMSPETWQEFTTFIECLPQNDVSDDVRYIFWKMYKEDAFRFTACDYDLGLESMVDYDRLCDIHNGNKCVDVVREKLKQKLIIVSETEQALPSIISLEKQYNNSKKSFLSIDRLSKPLPRTTIFKDIDDAMKSIRDILDKREDEASIDPSLNEKRKELKRKAAGYVSNEENSSEEDKVQEEKPKKQHWSARKMIDQQLPEVIKADLMNNSTDDED